jgi:hypothetical protein
MAANLMEKMFSPEECPKLGRKRNFFFARHGAGGGRKEEAVTLIQNSHPFLDFPSSSLGFIALLAGY